MDASAFEAKAQETLEHLFDVLDDVIGDHADVDLEGGILTVELEDGRQYVINKHAVNQEIWVSSPFSGAAHYAYDLEARAWFSTRGGEALTEVLGAEFSKISGKSLNLA
jgi:frataxin